MTETIVIRGREYFVQAANKSEGRYQFRPLVLMQSVESGRQIYRRKIQA